MADAVDRRKDDGKIRLPRVDSAMNRVAPRTPKGGKGSQDDEKNIRLGLKEKEQKEQKILDRARKRLEFASSEEAENRKNGLDDLRFEVGEGQWPQDVAAQRNFDKRPMLTLNKLPTFVNQITNDIRQNRPAIHYSPVGERADREVAKMLYGMVRQIWRASVADIALDTAVANATGAPGWGYVRVNTDWEAPTSMNQDIVIERIPNPFSVYLDPRCKSPTGAGARWCLITEEWAREDFEDTWPDADPMPWVPFGIGDSSKNWNTEKTVKIAEYFEIEDETRTLVQLSTGHVGWQDELDEKTQSLIDAGTIEVVRERESECPKVMWYKLTAIEILEQQEWVGSQIPIVKFVGNEKWVESKVKLSGIIRNAKQPQLLYNYFRTTEVEILAKQPKASYIIIEGQDEGYEQMWDHAHTRATSVLRIKPVSLDGKPAPMPVPITPLGVPQGIVQSSQQAAQDMMAVTGIRFDATLGERVYDESGKALMRLQERADMGSFHYVDNAANSLRQLGEILKELIVGGKIYDTRRVVTILREDDKEQQVVLDPNAPQTHAEETQNGKKIPIFNPTIGKYGVTVTIGPSEATKRIEASDHMIEFAKAAGPQIFPLIADLIAAEQDWPGAEKLAKRLAAAVPPNLMQPDMKDVPPQVQAVLNNLQQQSKQLQQELVVAQKQLVEKTTDQAIKLEGIEKTFEAKLLAVAQKAEADAHKHIGANIQQMADEVVKLREALANPETATNA